MVMVPEPDQTLEILMSELDPSVMQIFTQKHCKTAEEATVVPTNYLSLYYIITFDKRQGLRQLASFSGECVEVRDSSNHSGDDNQRPSVRALRLLHEWHHPGREYTFLTVLANSIMVANGVSLHKSRVKCECQRGRLIY